MSAKKLVVSTYPIFVATEEEELASTQTAGVKTASLRGSAGGEV